MESFIKALRICELTALANEVASVYQSNLLGELLALALLTELLSVPLASTLPVPSPLHLLPSTVAFLPITPGQWTNLGVQLSLLLAMSLW